MGSSKRRQLPSDRAGVTHQALRCGRRLRKRRTLCTVVIRSDSVKLGPIGFIRCTVGPVTEPWLSADDIAIHLGVTKDSVYAWIANKGMPAHRVGRLWKFQASEVDTWVRGGGVDAGSQAEDFSQATRADSPDK